MPVNQWVAQMKRIIRECPKGHWLFVAEGHLHLMKYGPNEKRAETHSGYLDQNYIVEIIMDGPEIDGGEW